MYSWWWSNFSLATSCEHASYKCISKKRWFTGLEGKWLRVTDERAKATSLKTAPVYINIYLVCACVCVWVRFERACVCVPLWKMPESVFLCVCVCTHVHTKCNHTCVRAINSNHSRNPSIARESIQKIMLFQFKGCEENERERSNKLGLPPTGIYLALRKTFAFSAFDVNSISVTHWQNNDDTLKKYRSALGKFN